MPRAATDAPCRVLPQVPTTTCLATSTWGRARAPSSLAVPRSVGHTRVRGAACATCHGFGDFRSCCFGGPPFCELRICPRPVRAAANVTWWNLYPSGSSSAPLALPSCDFGPQLFFAGNWGAPSKSSNDGGDRRRRLLAGTDTALAGSQAPEAAAAPGPSESRRNVISSSLDGTGERAAALSMASYCAQQKWRVEEVDPGMQLWPADIYAAMVAARQQARVFR